MALEQFAKIVVPVQATPFGLRYWLDFDLEADTVPAARVRVMYKRWLREEGFLPLATQPVERPRMKQLTLF